MCDVTFDVMDVSHGAMTFGDGMYRVTCDACDVMCHGCVMYACS